MVIDFAFANDTVRKTAAAAVVSNPLWQTDLQNIVTPYRPMLYNPGSFEQLPYDVNANG